MIYRYGLGDPLRLIRNIRNDGTYPGVPQGELMVRRGAVGYVRDVGIFLQDQIIYSLEFVELGLIIGCREEELIPEAEEWTPSRFEFREQVTPTTPLGMQGEVVASPGEIGEVVKVIKMDDSEFHYHVHFSGRVTMQVPEGALQSTTA